MQSFFMRTRTLWKCGFRRYVFAVCASYDVLPFIYMTYRFRYICIIYRYFPYIFILSLFKYIKIKYSLQQINWFWYWNHYFFHHFYSIQFSFKAISFSHFLLLLVFLFRTLGEERMIVLLYLARQFLTEHVFWLLSTPLWKLRGTISARLQEKEAWPKN